MRKFGQVVQGMVLTFFGSISEEVTEAQFTELRSKLGLFEHRRDFENAIDHDKSLDRQVLLRFLKLVNPSPPLRREFLLAWMAAEFPSERKEICHIAERSA